MAIKNQENQNMKREKKSLPFFATTHKTGAEWITVSKWIPVQLAFAQNFGKIGNSVPFLLFALLPTLIVFPYR